MWYISPISAWLRNSTPPNSIGASKVATLAAPVATQVSITTTDLVCLLLNLFFVYLLSLVKSSLDGMTWSLLDIPLCILLVAPCREIPEICSRNISLNLSNSPSAPTMVYWISKARKSSRFVPYQIFSPPFRSYGRHRCPHLVMLALMASMSQITSLPLPP